MRSDRVAGGPSWRGRQAVRLTDCQGDWIAERVGRPELAPLGPDDIEELAGLLTEERYPAGATIFRVGEAPTRIGIVRCGAVELPTAARSS